MAGNAKVPFSKVPFADLNDKPDGQWSDSIIGGLNEAMLALSGNSDSIQIKTVDIVTPDPWKTFTFQGDWASKPGVVKYMRHYDGSIQIRGHVDAGTPLTTAFNLPQDCLPPSAMLLPSIMSGGTAGYFSILGSGQVQPSSGSAPMYIHHRYMPVNNRPQPLDCFPVNVLTRFKSSPRAVLCIRNQRVVGNRQDPVCNALMPAWRFINASNGPTVQITDIPGLEYGCRQRVTVAIIGG